MTESTMAHVHEHIFEDDRPFAECHASTLVQLSDDHYLAAWFAGTREGHADVAIWLAVRFQGRWSSPRQVARVKDEPHWNPVLFAEPGGPVHLYFKVGPKIATWQTWHCESHDTGQTWTEPRELVPGDHGGRGPVKNKPIVLADGTWLAPASLEDGGHWRAFVDRSRDRGRTWTASAPISISADERQGPGIIQPTLWESQPGQVHMLLRSSEGRIYRSDSHDAGLTWRSPYATDLPGNNSGLDVARLHDGTLALVYNPVESRRCDMNARSPLAIALSFDNGRTWPREMLIEREPGEYSYPAIIPTQTGMAAAYTWRRERIAFWLGSIECIAPR